MKKMTQIHRLIAGLKLLRFEFFEAICLSECNIKALLITTKNITTESTEDTGKIINTS